MALHPDRRTSALSSRVRALIAPVLRECPPECGIVAITRVDVTTDQAYATVYISALKEKKRALAFLENRQRDLQKQLSKLGTKFMPKLRIRLDQEGDRASRLDAILDGHPSAGPEEMSKSLDNDASDDSSNEMQ